MPWGFPDAVGIRADHRRQITGAVVHTHQHIRNPRLANILNAVRIQIVPRPVTQRHVQPLVIKRQSPADQVQTAIGRIRRCSDWKIGRIASLCPIRPIRGRVIGRQRIAIKQIVGLQPQRLPTQKNARERLHVHIGGRMLGVAILGITAHHNRVQRHTRRPPLRLQHTDHRSEAGWLAIAVQRRDRGNLEPVVAAAIHHQESALLNMAMHWQTIGEQIINTLDVVVVPVAIALIRKYVIGPVVDHRTAQRRFHRGRVAGLQQDVRAGNGRLFVEHDVVRPCNRRPRRPGDVDLASQGNAV